MGYYKQKAEFAVINQYKAELEQRNLSAHTVDQRIRCLRDVAKNITLNADKPTIEAWMNAKNISAKTKCCHLSHLHAFFAWAMANDIAIQDPTVGIVRPSVARKAPVPIPERDLALALSKAEPRIKAWLLLGAFAGLRCEEIANLTRDDILEDWWLHVAGTRTGTERIVPLHPSIMVALNEYGMPNGGPLFTRYDGEQSHAEDVSQRLGRFFRLNKINSSAHSLRNYFAAQTLKACHDVRVVQDLMGLQDPGSLTRYKHLDLQAGKQAVASLSLAEV